MLDPKLIRSELDDVAEKLKIKNFSVPVEKIQTLEADRKRLQVETEAMQAERNSRSKEIGVAKSKGEDASPILEAMASLGTRLDATKNQLDQVQNQLEEILLSLPNLPDASVPSGKSEEDNIEIRRWGDPTEFSFKAWDHVDLTKPGGPVDSGNEDLSNKPSSNKPSSNKPSSNKNVANTAIAKMDFENASKISGSRFVVLRAELAQLHRALIQFMLDVHIQEHGYEEIYVPYIVNRDSLLGTGQLPKMEEDLFKLEDDRGFYLIPTAEVPVTNMARDTIFEESSLPLKLVCHSPCFRSEAGSYGKDTRGMIRQHQFEKVEMVQMVKPEHSQQAHEELTQHAENILQKLGLPYRLVNLCGGDLGFSATKTYDLEVWLPGQEKYREISSCSHFGDFQARRMQGRWRNPETGKPSLLHTINGSGLAVGRTLVAVLENYQQEDGSVMIPQALQSYMGNISAISF